MHNSIHHLVALALLSLSLALGGCGGGGGSSSPPPASPAVSSATPIASFAAPATANANATVVFDASASTSSDGTALQYVWDFGNDQRGGGKTIARVFGSGGVKTVTLTVIDGAQLSASQTKTVTIAAPAAPAASLKVRGSITTVDGVALEGVTLAQQGGSASAISSAMGKAEVTLGIGVPLTLKLSKAGYADQFVNLQLPASTGADASFAAVMRPRDAALTLADAAVGGSLTGRDGASVTLPANALVNGAGTRASGAVQIAITPVDVTQPAAGGFPGSFDGIQPDGSTTPIVSFGVSEYVLTAAGQSLQLAPGQTATIEVPIYGAQKLDGSVLAAGDSTPLWSLDESTGMWVQEGTGTVVASAGSPSGLAMRATVSHFSWWNSDIGFDPYGPKPRCVYDTDSGVPGGNDTFATATICNMLADIDRGTNSNSNGLSLSAKARAAPLPPRVAGFSATAIIPIAGGITMAVPANVNVALNATALNGTWVGRTVVKGPVGVREEVLIKMRPIAGTGPAPEAIALPLDTTRGLQTGQTAIFTFSGSARQYARITVSQNNGSTLTGRVRLLQGSTALATADFGAASGRILTALPANGSYSIEVTGLTNVPGVYRLQAELLGGTQSEVITLPFDVTRVLPQFTSYRGTFDITAPTTLYIAYRLQGGVPAQLRVTGPNSVVVYSALSSTSGADPVTLSLTPGSYAYEVVPEGGQSASFRLTGKTTPWAQVAPGIDVQSPYSLIDMVADRNGKPVLFYTSSNFVNGNRGNGRLYLLRRWTGSAWEAVASDLSIDYPCTTSNADSASIAFDSANNPVIAYSSAQVTDGSFTAVSKFISGAWQPISPNNGVVPNSVSTFASACRDTPVLQLDAADVPVLAYRSNTNTILVQRYNGTAWQGIVAASGDSFAASNGGFDLKLDANGRLYLVVGSGVFQKDATIVRQLSAAPTPAWETVGPNGGRLPETNTVGLSLPRLRFDAAGKPVIAAIASIDGGSGALPGTAVYRYDGSNWTSTGGYQTGAGSSASNMALGFTLFNGDAIVAWDNRDSLQQLNLVIQRNTSAGWSAIGAGLGEVPQFSDRLSAADLTARNPRLIQIGTELYLALVTAPLNSVAVPAYKLTLMRKVAN